MPAQEVVHALAPVFVGAPVREGQLDVPPVDREALLGGDVPVPGFGFAEDPRFDQRAARDHHRGAAGCGAALVDLMWIQEIAVADDGHRDRRRHFGDRVPVGRVAVPRFARAAVHGERRGAAVHRRAGEIEIVPRRGVPPEPDLHGHRHLHRGPQRFDDAPYAAGLARQRRAQAHAREVIDRTAEIDVDEVGAARFRKGRGPGEFIGLVAGELDAEAGLVRRPTNEGELAAAPLAQPAGDHHLADEHARTQFPRELAVGQVRALRHGRHDDRAGELRQK